MFRRPLYRNIVFAFLIHIFIVVFSVGLLMAGTSHRLMIATFCVALIGYVGLGYAFLVPLKSAIGNLMSVSMVSLLGLCIGGYSQLFPSPMGYSWMLYLGYYVYAWGLSEAVPFTPRPVHMLWMTELPALFLWVGLQVRAWYGKRGAV
ncbi:hypothetical protein [Paenibacillus whitsoniae]|uniref:ABC transporter permease n=1 Tax=Paenibacillus whitsoniae TaxID=2496558 RepID=A0A3S0CSM0_9BACL|nr:hypothetical protein [Paenibacillus whitsoniae]RTE07824.1 hypothetical protein EJQ19_20480 [Paenibacillus whitsoniae]